MLDDIVLRPFLHNLLSVFIDPEIVKVFHGCDSDILWLQRDFGLYIINCFDTYFAAKLLRCPALSLSHLLKFYCGVTLNKKHQLSDWRQRPLPQDMLHYARDDTHYLLYLYDILRREVYRELGTEGLISVLDSSRRSCMQRYEKEPFFPRGYVKLVQQASARRGVLPNNDKSRLHGSTNSQKDALTMEQDLALAALWDWRDALARQLDESVAYIASNAELLRIGLAVPKDESSLLKCSPLSSTVCSRMKEILEVISTRLLPGATQTTLTYSSAAIRADPIGGGVGDGSPIRPKAISFGDPRESRTESFDATTVLTFTPSTLSNKSDAGPLRGGFVPIASPVMGTNEVR